ncbi:MAG: SDR family NAD(P)-dependent oxidoreductase [Candidatus Poribacteria bacterium]|nr:SDR family NAD(P)-dependent oxidoreductase [Candidatus Poribacteria bacterium]
MEQASQQVDAGQPSARRLVDKVAAVTGAGQGIGRAIAMRLAQEGASVFASDIQSGLLEQLERDVKTTGAQIATGTFDAANVADAARFVQAAVTAYGRIDIMVNNAGGIRVQPFPGVTEETWDWTVDLNLKGPYFYMQEAAKHMMTQKRGTIINIASVAGIAGGMTYSPPYAACKAAIINLTKVAAAKLAEYGITVNAIAPGIVDTAFNWGLDEEIGVKEMGLAAGELLNRRRASIPLGRLQQPEDIANVVAFLASDDASEIAGETVVVSGGLVVR